MSRTYRRKNFEQEENGSWKRDFRKVNGFYTKVEFIYVYDTDDTNGGVIVSGRMPTKEELWWLTRWAHGESSTRNSRSPGKEFRKARMVENRGINKRELDKFMKLEDYEPMFEENPRPCGWDWR